MARDGAFFRSAGHIHPHFKTPAVSIVAQAAFAILLVLTGSLDALANYVGFAITLFLGLAVAAVFVLRSREPNAPRPFRTWGYPVTPAIFTIASAVIVVNAFYSDTRRTLIGAAIILAGIPVYAIFRRRNRV
jgi:APA family basic amino acid/polyamine antiporter